MPKWIPTAPEVVREALIVLTGAVIATIVVRYFVPDSLKGLFSLPGQNNPPGY